MIDTAQQHIIALEKKVGLDAKSPLFAQLAHYYLEASRAQDALRICDAGLANFPFYTTGHLIKGKALVALHMQAEARREFEFVLDFLPDNETLITLLTQIPLTAEESLTIAPQEELLDLIPQEPVPLSMAEYDYPGSTSREVQSSPEQSFGFGEIEQPAPEQQSEPMLPFASPAQNFFEEITQPHSEVPIEDASGFGLDAPTVETPATFETSPFSEFNFPQPEPLINSTAPLTEESRGFEFTPSTSDINLSLPSTISEEETFEHYASRRTKELSGENTVSREDYLSNKTPAKPQEFTLPKTDSMPQEFVLPSTDSISAGVQNKIEELTNKLQSAGKITPVINFAQKETPTASEQDTSAGMGFVTPTLAEIYAKQGWFDDAIKAYRSLARNKPAEKERFEKRIAELEELKKKNGE
jgi:tetratricopeptide (TPR) repeat protein